MHGLVSCFMELGYQVTIVPVALRRAGLDEMTAYWQDQNVTVKIFPTLLKRKEPTGKLDFLRRAIFPRETDYYHVDEVESSGFARFVAKSKFSAVVSYNWCGLGVIAGLDHPARFASLVDPLEDSMAMVRAESGFALNRKQLKKWLAYHALRAKPVAANRYLSKMSCIIEHAHQHAEEYRQRGFENVCYLPHPLPCREPLQAMPDNGKVNVLILGSLKGLASRRGYAFFLDEILPRLESRLDEMEIPPEFRIVGHGQMPDELRDRLEANALCNFIGFVDEVEPEFARADIMLVNVPVAHGFRTRIAEAFSYGKCVMAHAANAVGMPEIQDEVNALTATDPDEYVDKLVRAICEPELRARLGECARKHFESHISKDAAVAKLRGLLQG